MIDNQKPMHLPRDHHQVPPYHVTGRPPGGIPRTRRQHQVPRPSAGTKRGDLDVLHQVICPYPR